MRETAVLPKRNTARTPDETPATVLGIGNIEFDDVKELEGWQLRVFGMVAGSGTLDPDDFYTHVQMAKTPPATDVPVS